MKDNKDLKNTYNKIANDWCKDHKGDDWWIPGADAFINLLAKGSKVLDVGCGGGYKTKYLQDKGLDASGVDFSEGMIDCAKEKFPNIKFNVLDLYDFDTLNEKFDGIFAQAVLLHIPKIDIFNILEKMKSKLKDGGLLYIAVKEIKNIGIEEEVKKENDYGYEYERFFSYFTRDEILNYFKKLSLEIVYDNTLNSGRSNWINIIGKK